MHARDRVHNKEICTDEAKAKSDGGDDAGDSETAWEGLVVKEVMDIMGRHCSSELDKVGDQEPPGCGVLVPGQSIEACVDDEGCMRDEIMCEGQRSGIEAPKLGREKIEIYPPTTEVSTSWVSDQSTASVEVSVPVCWACGATPHAGPCDQPEAPSNVCAIVPHDEVRPALGSTPRAEKLAVYFTRFKSLEQIFACLDGKESEEARLAELGARIIKDWQALLDTFRRWEKVSHETDGNEHEASALTAAVRRAALQQGGVDGARRMFKVVQNRPEVASIVNEGFAALRDQQWCAMPSGHQQSYAWNMLWTWSKPKINWKDLHIWQRVNHFPEAKQLTRKDNLKRHLMRFRNIPGKLGDFFDILPTTYTLPGDYVQFCTEFAKRHESDPQRNYWIMKPAGSSRGRGIFVFNDIGAVSYTECVIVQRYIERPLLLDGYKFDLRLYVCVTSMNPLECFLYREGFTRLSSEPYSTDPRDMANRFIHLTNSSINRHNPNNIQQDSMKRRGELAGGSKCSLHYLQTRMREINVDWPLMWKEIVSVVLKTLYCVQDVIPNNQNAFELFGFDVLIDADLKAWLIEVNSSPSLSRENALDHEIKNKMIADTLRIAAPPAVDRDILAELLKKRLGERSKRHNIDKDLPAKIHQVLRGQAPRPYGVEPAEMGNYERIAPSAAWDDITRLFKKANPKKK